MKLITIFILAGFLQVSANIYSQTANISLDIRQSSLKDVIKNIQNQTEFIFFYNPSDIQGIEVVNVELKKASLEETIDRCLKDTGLEYEIKHNAVILKRSLKQSSPRGSIVPVEEPVKKKLTGVVTGNDGAPIPGTTVMVKGMTIGTVTDVNGAFQLLVSEDAKILVFSFVGMKTREMVIGNSLDFKVVMEEESIGLDEVVAVGYGTQKKASVVGAIVQTTSEELKRTGGVTNLAQALTGQLSGVTVIQNSGEPGGDDPKIFIRGMGTWNNAQPLILVDGIERKMNEVDVNEVESVSVLKDASATAVFGVKGAEGVILITTKRGQLGKPVISFDANVSTKTLSKMPEKLNSYDQFQYRNEAIEYQLNRGGEDNDWGLYTPYRILQYYKQPQANGLQYLFPDVDWASEMLKPFPVSYRANLSVSGGTEFAKYFGSISYTFEDDLIKTNDDFTDRGYKAQNSYERLNFRSNLDLSLTKSTVFSVNLAGWVGTKRNGYNSETSDQNLFRSFQEYSPDMFPMVFPDGSYGYDPEVPTRDNPYRTANNNGVEATRNINLSTDFILKQDLDFITKGLSARLSFSYDNSFITSSGIADGGQARSLYIDPAAIDILYMDENGSYIDENGNFNVKEGYNLEDYMLGYIKNQNANHDYDWSEGSPNYDPEVSGAVSNVMRRVFYQAQVNYNQTFGRHDVGALALVNREQYAKGSMFPRYREDWVGRLTYGYANRYLFESNFAYNGSEKFGKGYRFGFFPSVAAGWMITEEPFMKNIKGMSWLNKLKIRYTIGKIGNDNFDAPRWAYQTNWSLGSDRTYFNGDKPVESPYTQYYESVIGNEDLHWETAVKQNLGIEVGLFKSKIGLNLDLFRDRRSDIFLSAGSRTIPAYFGASPVSANLGETRVKGYEMELSLKNTFRNGLYAYLNINHTGAFDEILYREDAPLLPDYQKQEGYPINQVRTQIDAGYTNNWNEVYSATGFATGNAARVPGEYRIIDFNGDGTIDASDSAPYSYPQNRPQHTYGVIFGGEYKGFSLMVQFYGVYNVTRQYDWMHVPFSNLQRTGPVFEAFTDTWTPENTDARYRAIAVQMSAIQGLGTYMYEDGSYLRLKTAEIGYTMRNVKEILGISSVRFYLNGNNLLFWSKMVNDYEDSGSSTLTYPLVRRFNLGVNVKF
ncbi:MAG: TonB-dependent receptor [Prolixibacteraceae bacterium]